MLIIFMSTSSLVGVITSSNFYNWMIILRKQVCDMCDNERRIGRAGCCGGLVAQWLWRLQSDTLGSSPAVAVFSLFSFLSKWIGFQ